MPHTTGKATHFGFAENIVEPDKHVQVVLIVVEHWNSIGPTVPRDV